MRQSLVRLASSLARTVSLVLLAALGTVLLMRFAPGYFSDVREMDAQYASGARAELAVQRSTQSSVTALGMQLVRGWTHCDLGLSKQYDLPVTELMRPRMEVTAKLLFTGIASGWLVALALALPLSARRTPSGEALIAAPMAVLLAIPIGAMATASLLLNLGGPVLVLTTLIAVRDFKFVYRLLRTTWRAPYLLFARAQGLSWKRMAWKHLLPNVLSQIFAIAMMSLVLALSAIVPVEVVFDVPGLGQLAWSAAMNRDLPVLLAVTMLMAVLVGLASAAAKPGNQREAVLCG
jgi:peptide/nickel transport system permease protein